LGLSQMPPIAMLAMALIITFQTKADGIKMDKE
jgi:hypothetical protein